jgi:hypothetical protein
VVHHLPSKQAGDPEFEPQYWEEKERNQNPDINELNKSPKIPLQGAGQIASVQ